jgi:DNA-binding NtrC family response regulator
VKAGRFRADLYHRLSVFSLAVPPLRDMGEDRLLLLEHYRDLFAGQAGRARFEFDDEALALWRGYRFPGNVRELRNIVIRLVAKYPGQRVGTRELAAELDLQDEDSARGAEAPAVGPPHTAAELARVALEHLQSRGPFSLDDTLRLWEQAYVDAALRLTHGNVSQAAKLLGINRTTLYNRMDNLARE